MTLIGGGPQGTLLGQIEYLVQSNDNADIVSPDDRFNYIDDLSVLQLICLSGLLIDYDFKQKFLPAEHYQTQDILDYISHWTKDNLMKINKEK